MNAMDALRTLATRFAGSTDNPQRSREALEASLVPLIRCALRSGTGLPPLVQWVRRHAPTRQGDPASLAPVMARQLTSALLQQAQPRPALETVPGR